VAVMRPSRKNSSACCASERRLLFDSEQTASGPEQTRGSPEHIIPLMRDEIASGRPGYAFYRDVFGGWRWEYFDHNGDAFDSRESFETPHECVQNARMSGPARPVLATAGRHGPSSCDGPDHAEPVADLEREQQTRRAA
jgi:hypothetical protein